jgi:hypothetical protein
MPKISSKQARGLLKIIYEFESCFQKMFTIRNWSVAQKKYKKINQLTDEYLFKVV